MFEYLGFTYGIISANGTAVSVDGDVPFFELPKDSLEEAHEFDGFNNEARDKLQAALNHDGPYHEGDLPLGYIVECTRWYVALSEAHQTLAPTVCDQFDRGDEATAEKVAAKLPAAPAYPHK